VTGRAFALESAVSAVLAAATALEEASDELCRLDSVAGDGDHGIVVAGAARSIELKVHSSRPPNVLELLRLVVTELGAVGGSIGPLSYVLVDALERRLRGLEPPLTAEHVEQLLTDAQEAVATVGGAQPGDKSIVDAIDGAREAARRAAHESLSARTALARAASGAERATEATAAMTARVGRASRLGSRSVGTVDPGARSFAIAIRALADTYAAGDDGDRLRVTSPEWRSGLLGHQI
jgi:dihydroxyacetone kinase